MSARDCRSDRSAYHPRHTLESTPHRDPLCHSIVFRVQALLCGQRYIVLGQNLLQISTKWLAWASNDMKQSLTSCLRKVVGYEIEICADNEHPEHV